MSNRWYVVKNGKELGPVEASHLKQMAASGQLQPTDKVRREDMQATRQASAIKGLFPSNRESPPPSPPPPANMAKSGTGTAGKIDKSVPIDDLRRRLTAFADKIPHDEIRNLGDSIKVLAASRLPVFRIEWTALFEQREDVERERPYDGDEAVPRRGFEAKNFDVWAQALPHSTAFDKSSAEIPLEATQQVRDCGQCAGHGAVPCGMCRGQKCVQCPHCSGTKVQACPTCAGSGMARQGRTVQKQRPCPGVPFVAPCIGGSEGDFLQNLSVTRERTNRVCRVCNGTGVQIYEDTEYYNVPCATCATSGRVCCQQCAGDGIVQCSSCNGDGAVTCATCQGKRKLVHYLAAIQSFEPTTNAVVVPAKGCPQECVKALDERADFKEVLQRANLDGELDTALGDGMDHLSPRILTLRDGLRAQSNHANRPAGERMRIGRASVYRLDYSLDGKPFSAWFSGNDGPVHAPNNPLTDSVAQSVEEAVAAWSEGRQREGEWTLRKALGMAKASPDCARALEPLKPRIPEELLRRASSFSLRFWFKDLSPVGRVLVGVPAGCLGLSVLGFCFLCVLGIFLGPTKQPKAATEIAANAKQPPPGNPAPKEAGGGLSGQYLPSVPGNVKRYEEEVYDPVDGRAVVFSEDRETYGKDNTLTVERTIKSPGEPPSRVSYRGERRERDGYVELTYIDTHQNKVLSMRVKVGANPGDEWPDARGEGKYRLVRFDKAEASGPKGPIELAQAVIEHRWEAVDGRGERTVTLTEIVLEREGGIQKEKSYLLLAGQKKLTRQRRLISSTYP